MFMADLMFMTPEGMILARPASDVRAGEERQAARKLAELGIPIVRSISGIWAHLKALTRSGSTRLP
jgi:N-dimethylarginine dimethylaminohydrolase